MQLYSGRHALLYIIRLRQPGSQPPAGSQQRERHRLGRRADRALNTHVRQRLRPLESKHIRRLRRALWRPLQIAQREQQAAHLSVSKVKSAL